MDIVKLVRLVEKEFGVVVLRQEVAPQNFGMILAIGECIERRRMSAT